jgi:putative ABC transport system substrate-binding protein
MRRRDFIKIIAGSMAIGGPQTARAQSNTSHRLGILMGNAEKDPEAQSWVGEFFSGLRRLGWTEGPQFHTDVRWAGGNVDRMRELAAELVNLQPDVILAGTTPVVAAILSKTKTIPIVFVQVTDPVGSGFVASLARPGGDVTGFATFDITMAGKWMQLLQELMPSIKHVAVIFNPDTAPAHGETFVSMFKSTASQLGIELTSKYVHSDIEIEAVLKSLEGTPDSAVAVMPDIFTNAHRALIIAETARKRLPTIYPFSYMATEGGLISYGVDLLDMYRRAPSYVDRILKGAKPSELPVQTPVRFQMVINRKTASSMGLTIPTSLLAAAEEVIE